MGSVRDTTNTSVNHKIESNPQVGPSSALLTPDSLLELPLELPLEETAAPATPTGRDWAVALDFDPYRHPGLEALAVQGSQNARRHNQPNESSQVVKRDVRSLPNSKEVSRQTVSLVLPTTTPSVEFSAAVATVEEQSVCDICGRGYETIQDLQTHIFLQHPPANRESMTPRKQRYIADGVIETIQTHADTVEKPELRTSIGEKPEPDSDQKPEPESERRKPPEERAIQSAGQLATEEFGPDFREREQSDREKEGLLQARIDALEAELSGIRDQHREVEREKETVEHERDELMLANSFEKA